MEAQPKGRTEKTNHFFSSARVQFKPRNFWWRGKEEPIPLHENFSCFCLLANIFKLKLRNAQKRVHISKKVQDQLLLNTVHNNTQWTKNLGFWKLNFSYATRQKQFFNLLCDKLFHDILTRTLVPHSVWENFVSCLFHKLSRRKKSENWKTGCWGEVVTTWGLTVFSKRCLWHITDIPWPVIGCKNCSSHLVIVDH